MRIEGNTVYAEHPNEVIRIGVKDGKVFEMTDEEIDNNTDETIQCIILIKETDGSTNNRV